MAKVTSSRNRSTRSASKPPTTGQNPGRANRQSISQAKVTQSGGGRSGSAKVTTGSGGAKPSSQPDGRKPRAITNGNNPAIRQLRAKAVQARRMAEGKSTVASRNRTAPTPAQRERLSNQVKQMRVPGDSGYVRAAEARGKAEVAKAQTRRNARSAMKNMEGTLKAARAARLLTGGLKGNLHIEAVKAGLQAYNTGDGTLKAALKRGDYKPKQGPTQKTTTASFNKKSFNEAFKAARSSGAKEFSWRGKRYNTKKKGE